MGKRLKRIQLWVSRRSYLPVLGFGALAIILLYSNEETSIAQNMAYDREIRDLKKQIELTKDSAKYYDSRHNAIVSGMSDLERIAREQYHMKRPSEDLFIVTEKDGSNENK